MILAMMIATKEEIHWCIRRDMHLDINSLLNECVSLKWKSSS